MRLLATTRHGVGLVYSLVWIASALFQEASTLPLPTDTPASSPRSSPTSSPRSSPGPSASHAHPSSLPVTQPSSSPRQIPSSHVQDARSLPPILPPLSPPSQPWLRPVVTSRRRARGGAQSSQASQGNVQVQRGSPSHTRDSPPVRLRQARSAAGPSAFREVRPGEFSPPPRGSPPASPSQPLSEEAQRLRVQQLRHLSQSYHDRSQVWGLLKSDISGTQQALSHSMRAMGDEDHLRDLAAQRHTLRTLAMYQARENSAHRATLHQIEHTPWTQLERSAVGGAPRPAVGSPAQSRLGEVSAVAHAASRPIYHAQLEAQYQQLRSDAVRLREVQRGLPGEDPAHCASCLVHSTTNRNVAEHGWLVSRLAWQRTMADTSNRLALRHQECNELHCAFSQHATDARVAANFHERDVHTAAALRRIHSRDGASTSSSPSHSVGE